MKQAERHACPMLLVLPSVLLLCFGAPPFLLPCLPLCVCVLWFFVAFALFGLLFSPRKVCRSICSLMHCSLQRGLPTWETHDSEQNSPLPRRYRQLDPAGSHCWGPVWRSLLDSTLLQIESVDPTSILTTRLKSSFFRA